jgi:hypothetical protein
VGTYSVTQFRNKTLVIIHSQAKNQVNTSNHSDIKWWQLNIWPNFKVQGPTIIEPEQNVNMICNSSLYTHIHDSSVFQTWQQHLWHLHLHINMYGKFYNYPAIIFTVLTWCFWNVVTTVLLRNWVTLYVPAT